MSESITQDMNYFCAVDILRLENIFEKICRDLELYKIEALLNRLPSKIYRNDRRERGTGEV